ncbi:MAG: endonuclease/exonuclease/phosphatase family protein [Aurantimonas endophytica]|uniref:endonuclease/exonuclease/phosphatase family protein n=1 Tax=Aurantimonas endophytica TaxID=1522175 RepID=UPI003002B66E
MARARLSFTTFNLLNLNRPGLPLYKSSKPWTLEEYDAKIDYTARQLKTLRSDVYGFQELWHGDALVDVLSGAGMERAYTALVPPGHDGSRIVCAGAVKSEILIGDPEWIERFPDDFILKSGGDDEQTSEIAVSVSRFSRPVLHFRIKPIATSPEIHVFVCHFKSKAPTQVFREPWYDKPVHAPYAEAIGAGLSTIRRTAEATALRMILTRLMKGTNDPVVVLGDVNDGLLSNTLNILTGQPRYLMGFQTGGGDTDLYTAQTLQQYRSTRDVYYTHVFQNERESLDQILVSQEFYDNSRRRIWSFKDLVVQNDHLNFDAHRDLGSNDHGVIRATFEFNPLKAAAEDATG